MEDLGCTTPNGEIVVSCRPGGPTIEDDEMFVIRSGRIFYDGCSPIVSRIR